MEGIKIVFARQAAHVYANGAPVAIKRDEAWDASDVVVRENKTLFGDAPSIVRSSTPRAATRPEEEQERPVERATRAPGERRPVQPGTGKSIGRGW